MTGIYRYFEGTDMINGTSEENLQELNWPIANSNKKEQGTNDTFCCYS